VAASIVVLLASEAGPKLSKTAIFFRGVIAVILGLVVFVGSVWLVLGTDVGFRRGLFLVLGCFAGFVAILSLLWFRYPQQAPKPAGPVCLGGKVNPEFIANGGAPDQASVEVEREQDGKTTMVSIPACTEGVVATKYFYPAIFLVASLVGMLMCMAAVRRIDRSEELAEAASTTS
jgi:hypothetical protein